MPPNIIAQVLEIHNCNGLNRNFLGYMHPDLLLIFISLLIVCA